MPIPLFNPGPPLRSAMPGEEAKHERLFANQETTVLEVRYAAYWPSLNSLSHLEIFKVWFSTAEEENPKLANFVYAMSLMVGGRSNCSACVDLA